MSALSRLQNHEDVTRFGVVRFSTPENILWTTTRIQLESTIDNGISFREEFELSECEWQNLLKHAHRFSWINILKSLVCRESDRACYHVQDALERISVPQKIVDNQRSLALLWNSQPPRSAKELFRHRLYDINAFQRLDFSDVSPEDNVFAEVSLPCGCYDGVYSNEVEAMSVEECKSAVCYQCRNDVLQPEDRLELAMGEQRVQREAWLRSNASWKDLNNTDFSLRTETMKMKANTLFHVLHGAFDSMKTCDLLCPASLAFENLLETRVALEALEVFLYGSNEDLIGTPTQVLATLHQKATDAVSNASKNRIPGESVTVPGFDNSLRNLLVRTMNFWLRRSCRKVNRAHYKFHMHQGVPFFSPQSWELSKQSAGVFEELNDSRTDLGDEETNVGSVDDLMAGMQMHQDE
ncbi:Hypothetical predicted protein [Lecanosticta acicola]|uniref:Uncharacterized protein n=1 Tax=Lecanosticta acicola TaxID=111012 RepID=A0AAI8Z3Z5_9PEZI|nr:Hypothetical predicted protein [Lecanosticta acicola]